MRNTLGTTENAPAFSAGMEDPFRGVLQWIPFSNDPAIHTTEPREYASVGMQETHAAGHDHGDLRSGFSGTANRQSSPDLGRTLTHTLQAVMVLSPADGIAWIDAHPIVPYMQRQVLAVRQVDLQQTCAGVGFCILNRVV